MTEAKELFEQLFYKASELAIQGDWAHAKSIFREILNHKEVHELEPEFQLKTIVHLADCCIQLDSFDDARKILEKPNAVKFSEAISDNSTKASYYLVYGHVVSEFMGLEAADKNFKKALQLVESSTDLPQIESILQSMLYVGRVFQNWDYLLERATLTAEIASEKGLLDLELQATGARAEASSKLGLINEAISLAKKILIHNRESKNVDEYSKWALFIEELKDNLEKKTLKQPTDKGNDNNIGIITIDELPQAGDAASQNNNIFEEPIQDVDLPDAMTNEVFDDSDFLPENTSNEPNISKPLNDEVEYSSISNKRKITPARLIPIPPIYGINLQTESDIDYKFIASCVLECYYYEIHKKGMVTENEKKSLQNLYGIFQINREEASKILQKVLTASKTKQAEKGEADYDAFFEKVHIQIHPLLPELIYKEIIQKIASAINHQKLKLPGFVS